MNRIFNSALLILCAPLLALAACGGESDDPAAGTVDSSELSTLAAPSGYTHCADENQRCNFSGTRTVAYGASGKFVYKELSGGVDCNNAKFGDPISGTFKACYLKGTGTGGARGRVKQQNGTLVTDQGSRLRGIGISPDMGQNASNKGAFLDASLTNTNGLNTVHVYAENWSITPGQNVAAVDEIVRLAEVNHYYVIIVPGGGPSANDASGTQIHGNGTYDLAWLKKFWSIYAPRYKDRTHVLYELMNEPDFDPCSGQYSSTVLDMEASIYKQIRAAAPSTHVMLLTYASLKTKAIIADAVDQLRGRGVDFSNASIATHGYDWGKFCNAAPAAALPDMMAGARSKGVALTVTEFDADHWQDYAKPMESSGIGYTHFKFVVGGDMGNFRNDVQAAGLSWCPDYGNWPQNSATCSGL